MKYRITTLLATSAAVALLGGGAAWADGQAAPAAAPAAPTPSPMPYPAMTAPLAANPFPAAFDAGPMGKITVDGVISGGGGYQDQPFPGQPQGFGDIDNAQVIINKSDGPIQFYVQAGAYSIVSLGASASTSSTALDSSTFGYVPQGFVKIVPNSSFSVEAGALPTLIGAEYTFSFENMNIERGLLWNQEPAISKGVQVNFSKGPISLSAAWTDGYYSGTYTDISGLLTFTFKNSDTLAFAAEGNVSPNHSFYGFSAATPVEQNDGQIYNLIFTHTQGPWTIMPYVQYNSSPYIHGYSSGGSAWGVAVLTKYNFTPEFSVAARAEYEGSSGDGDLLGYGVDSSAWSITVTPTYQKGIFFIRGEASYTGISGYYHSYTYTAPCDPFSEDEETCTFTSRTAAPSAPGATTAASSVSWARPASSSRASLTADLTAI